MKSPLLLLCLLWSLVEVYSQTVPYVTFMGEILPNQAYVNLFLVGNDSSGSDSVQCHTDLDTCCSHVQDRNGSDHRGNWIPPGSDSRLPFAYKASGDIIYEFHQNQRVELHRRNNADKPSGIYRCDIPTNAVHDNNDTTVRESVYVGLYASGGDITISGGMTYTMDSNLNETIPQSTLTCISTGGPATSVTWTRDTETITEGTETVLDDRVTAQYTHTLTVTGRLGGRYTCTVTNDKPSSASAQLTVNAPSNAPEMFKAVAKRRQVTFSWSPSHVAQCNGLNTSYTLSCSPSPSSVPQSFSQSGPLTVEGFSPNTSYSCSVVANNVLGSGPPAYTTFTTAQDLPTTEPGDNITIPTTTAIIGGVVTVILIITLVTVAIGVTLFLKKRCENVSTNKEEKNMVDLSKIAGTLPTTTNTAYAMLTQGGREEQESHVYEVIHVSPRTGLHNTNAHSSHHLPTKPQSVAPPNGGGVGVVRGKGCE